VEHSLESRERDLSRPSFFDIGCGGATFCERGGRKTLNFEEKRSVDDRQRRRIPQFGDRDFDRRAAESHDSFASAILMNRAHSACKVDDNPAM
jgi:hypothetical protein